jgi:hypothetical protein
MTKVYKSVAIIMFAIVAILGIIAMVGLPLNFVM